MKRYGMWGLALSLVVLLACSFSGINGNLVVGSGTLTTKDVAISGVARVEATTSGNLDIVFGDEESLVIEAEDNIIPLLTAEVRNGTLVLASKPNASYSTTKPIRYTLTLSQLEGLDLSGSGNAEINGLEGERLDVVLSGSGSIEPEGAVTILDADLSGSGNLRAQDLRADNVKVTVSGSGGAEVWAVDSLDATVSGSGTLRYYGSPSQLETDDSGSGEIRALGEK